MSTIYTAKAVYTMDENMSKASALVVNDKKITGVGTLEELKAQFPDADICTDFESNTILPGFIDSHTHPMTSIMMFGGFKLISKNDWDLGDVQYKKCDTREEFFMLLKEYADELEPGVPLFIWGHLDPFYGKISKHDIDKVVSDRPVCVLKASFHGAAINSKGLEEWNLTPELAKGFDEELIPLDDDGELLGSFQEDASDPIIGIILQNTATPEKLAMGAKRFIYTVQKNGVTTIGGMSLGINGFEKELAMYGAFLNQDSVKMRAFLAPYIKAALDQNNGDVQKAFEYVNSIVEKYNDDTSKVSVLKAAKFMVDGSLIGHTAYMSEPYEGTDYRGALVLDPDTLGEEMLPYWKEGYAIYSHSQGDATQDLLMDVLEELQEKCPREEFIYRLEHFGISRKDQFERLGKLKPQITTLSYNFPLSWMDSLKEIGKYKPETIENMFAMRSAIDAGLSVSVHSDAIVSPIEPLLGAQGAMLRKGGNGHVYAENERITLDEAMRAITIEGAKQLGSDSFTGSLEVGKRADFVVLEENPYEVSPERLNEISVITTIFEGQK